MLDILVFLVFCSLLVGGVCMVQRSYNKIQCNCSNDCRKMLTKSTVLKHFRVQRSKLIERLKHLPKESVTEELNGDVVINIDYGDYVTEIQNVQTELQALEEKFPH